MRIYVVTNDWQIPFHDQDAIDVLMRFTKWLKPDGIILNGDIIDCYELSEFSKDPLLSDVLSREKTILGQVLNQFKQYAKTRELIYLGGNHEDRVRKYIWKYASKLQLPEHAIFELVYRIEDYGFAYFPYGHVYKLGKLDVTHGSCVRAYSGWTARAHFERLGGSVLIGHTHRLGAYYKTNGKGMHCSYENGCMCRLDPEYLQFPDWQQGFSVVNIGNRGFFHVQQIPIVRDTGVPRIFYGQQIF